MTQDTAIPKNLNLALGSLIALIMLAQLFALPVLLAAQPGWLALVIILLTPFNTPFWSLIHEAVHQNFHPGRKKNEFAGRALSVLFGACFGILRFDHLMHHQFNRDWESEIFDPAADKKWQIALNHYFKLLGGLWLIEVVTSFLLALAPRGLSAKMIRRLFPDEHQYQAVMRALLKEQTLRKIRIDCALIVLVYGAAFIVFAQNWPLLLLLIYMRALAVSVMDNAYHYDTPPDNSVAAKELAVPRPLAAFILNFNHHRTHHDYSALPWDALASQREKTAQPYTQGLLSALLAQFKGPIAKDKFKCRDERDLRES